MVRVLAVGGEEEEAQAVPGVLLLRVGADVQDAGGGRDVRAEGHEHHLRDRGHVQPREEGELQAGQDVHPEVPAVDVCRLVVWIAALPRRDKIHDWYERVDEEVHEPSKELPPPEGATCFWSVVCVLVSAQHEEAAEVLHIAHGAHDELNPIWHQPEDGVTAPGLLVALHPMVHDDTVGPIGVADPRRLLPPPGFRALLPHNAQGVNLLHDPVLVLVLRNGTLGLFL
mmetsp:Transcript_84262/g.262106  ORF Transcript_84262/g.262106 Transcript_84262/m.262106 type:complete len:227 (-) Transcript_84262:316-996(-)